MNDLLNPLYQLNVIFNKFFLQHVLTTGLMHVITTVYQKYITKSI